MFSGARRRDADSWLAACWQTERISALLGSGLEETLLFTFGAEVHALHVERAIPQGYFLQYDAKTVHIPLLGPLRRVAVVQELLRGRPQLLWKEEAAVRKAPRVNIGRADGCAEWQRERGGGDVLA